MAVSEVELIVFDLDGTLADSQDDIVAAFNVGLFAAGAPPLTAAEIRPFIGTPLKDMYENFLGPRLAHLSEAACEAYRSNYFDHCADTTRVFRGALEALDALSRIPMAIATTKKTYMAKRLVEALGLSERFILVQGTDDLPPKPDPAVLLLVAKSMGARPGASWMVGDTVHDIRAARAAGMACCAVTYGMAPRGELFAAGPDLIVDDLRDLAEHIL